MKTRITIVLITLGILLSAIPVLRCSETEAGAMVSHAYSVIMTPNTSTDAIMKALMEILDASVLILPKTDYSDEYRSRIEVAKKTFVERSMLNEKARQYVGLAYRLVNGGKVWQMPEEMTSAYREKDIMAQAGKISQKLVDSALSELKAGRNEQSVRYLLEFVLMVITPIQA